MKHKNQMPSYYGKNIAQHAQRRFFQRKKLEVDREKRRDRLPVETGRNGVQGK